jgi:DNA-binding transcriptional LysR family regulator
MFSLTAHHLQVFLTAAETLNFTQAAQKLQISQPSVSQQIQSLEEHFGASLFARSNRNIELTEAGTILLPLAREVIFLCTHVEETMASLKGDVYGHLVVGCSTSTGRYLLPQLLASFHRMHTQVRATCKIVSPHHAVQLLSEGSIHLCLTSDPPPIEDIEFRKLTTENLVLIAHPDHPWAGKGDIEPGSLYHADFILPEDGTEAHGSIREALACAGISIYKLNTLVSLGSPEQACQWASDPDSSEWIEYLSHYLFREKSNQTIDERTIRFLGYVFNFRRVRCVLWELRPGRLQSLDIYLSLPLERRTLYLNRQKRRK